MANTVIQLKKSGTPSATPATLANGELAINYADGKLFYKDTLGNIQEISGGGGGPFFGSINVAGTLVVPDIPGDILTINSGNNIELTPDTINDSYTITANLKPAFDVANAAFNSANNVAPQVTPAFNVANAAFAKANAALANTSGVSFAGNLFFPTGNVGIGTSSPSSKLQVNGTITIANTGPVETFRSGANTITLNMYDEANGTLSWEGSAGQLFSITNDLSGSLFTVNDVSGIPSIEVDALGNVDLAPFGGNVGIGTSNPVYKLDVQGDARITGNLTLGDATTDTITVNAANFNLANNVSFDSGTLFIDAQNNRVGVGITNPQHSLSVNGSIHLTTGDGDRIWSGSNNLRLGSYPELAVSDTLRISGGQQSIVFGGTGAYATIGSNVPWDFVKGTTPQGIRIHGTFTNVSNYERLNISANSTAAYIRTENAGTGVARPLYLGANNQTVVSINADKSVGVKQTLVGRSSIDHVTYSIFEASVDDVYLCNNSNRSGPGYPPSTIYIGGLASDNFNRDLFKISSSNIITTGAKLQVVRPAVDANTAFWSGIGALQISRSIGTNNLGIGTSANDLYAWFQYWFDGSVGNIILNPVGGNVGIGTTTPAYRLDVNGSAKLANTSFLYWGNYNETTVGPFIRSNGNDSLYLESGPNGPGRGVISLKGYNNSQFETAFGVLSLKASQVGSGYITLDTAGSERVRVDASGNVGIGTTSTLSKVHIVHASPSSSNGLRIADTSGANVGVTMGRNGNDGYFEILGLNDVYGLRIRTSGSATDRFSMDSYGNVTITGAVVTSSGRLLNGLTSAFYVSAGLPYDAGIQFRNGSNGYKSAIQPSGGSLVFYTNGNNTDFDSSMIRMTIDTSGKVGIGTTSPTANLHVIGTANVSSTIYTRDIEAPFYSLYNEGAGAYVGIKGNYLRFGGVSEFMRIANTSGYVGIGTSAPAYRLDVTPTSNEVGLHLAPTTGYDTGFYITPHANNDTVIGSGAVYVSAQFVAKASSAEIINLYNGGYYFYGDTGLTSGSVYSPTMRMVLDSSGRLGIGTSSPSARLHIAKAGTSDEFIIGDLASNYVKMGGIGSGISYIRSFESAFDINNPFTNGVLLFSTAGSERLRITSTGNVGIGTSSPSANLHVVGSVLIYPNSLNATSRLRTRSVHADGRWAIDMNANGTDAKLAQIYSGTIGLGTGSFSSGALDTAIGFADDFAYIPKLRIGGINSGPANISYISITANNTSEWNYGNSYPDGNNYYQIRTSLESGGGAQRAPLLIGAKYLYFATGATDNERMRIDANGNVGIGTTAPQTLLDVAGSDNNGIQYRTATRWISIGSSGGLSTVASGSGTEMVFSVGSERMRINANGNIGIGTTTPTAVGSSATLSINSATAGASGILVHQYNGSQIARSGVLSGYYTVQDLGSTNGLMIDEQSALPILFRTNATERMRITSNGNIGIGTSSPSYLFHLSSNNTSPSGDIARFESPVTSGGFTTVSFRHNVSGGADVTTAIGGDGTKGFVGTTSNTDFALFSNFTEKMRITSGGNVGIDTTSPSEKLHVANGSILLDRTYYLKSKDDQGTVRQLIGTSADGTVNVRGFRGTSMMDGVNGSTYLYDSGGSGVQRLSVTSTGVGIGGILAAAEKLEVNGNIKANSYIMVNSAMAPITVITAASTDQIIDSFTTSTWRSAQYNITMTSGTDYHTTQISLIHDGTNAYITEYGTLSTANNLGTFSATVSGSTVRLNVVPTFANTSINMLRTTNK